MSDLDTNSPDPVAVRLGYLALLPFALGAALVWFAPADWAGRCAAALSAYAAVVVSFIGGIYWGLGFSKTVPRWTLFAWGVIPSLVAAPALLLAAADGLAVQGAMLVICYLVDRKGYPDNGIAHYLPLRFRLTAAAAICCFAAAAGLRLA